VGALSRGFFGERSAAQHARLSLHDPNATRKPPRKRFPSPVAIDQGDRLLKSFDATKFDQSVELIFSLGIDAKQADQMIRGSLSLPHGVGKTKRVVAFCPEHLAPAGSSRRRDQGGRAGTGAAIEKENFTDFDVAISTPDMMRFVGRLGKVLGPKGLMPSPKAGTVTPDIAAPSANIRPAKSNSATTPAAMSQRRRQGQLLQGQAVDNINAMIAQIRKMKPQTSKGLYFKKVVLKGHDDPGGVSDSSIKRRSWKIARKNGSDRPANARQRNWDPMSKKVKESLIERDLTNRFKDLDGVAVINPRGINAIKNNQIRRRLREKGLKFE
jgi:large subunit ribosomal protein L1